MPTSDLQLPAELLHAVAGPGVVLVVGAGCSFEPPTSLPLGRTCSEEAHRLLVADGVLLAGECTHPEDLSQLADAVFARTSSQNELVRRMPRSHFLQAEPNEGYLMAAALLLEGAVTSLLTLNFDLAMVAALTQLGSQGRVSVISGLRGFADIGSANVVYLHRDANAPADEWILRSAALDDEWRNEWQDALATKLLTAPVVVFAGLGTPAAVLVDTIRRIRATLGSGIQVFQVDAVSHDKSAFFAALGIPPASFFQLGWCAFMAVLARRLVEEHRAALDRACHDLTAQEGLPTEDIAGVVSRMLRLGLVDAGRLRGRWLLDDRSYVPHRNSHVELIADLLLAVALIERSAGVEAVFGDDGVVEFHSDNRLLGIVILASGQGTRRWLSLETRLAAYRSPRRVRVRPPRVAIVAGVVGGCPSNVAAPRSVLGEVTADSITSPSSDIAMVGVDEIRADPSRIGAVILD